MGYRSKVIIGVKNGKLSDEFDEVLQKHDFKTTDHSSDYLKIHTENDGMKFYRFEQIKWYEMEDWCKDIMDWLEKEDDNTTDMQNGLHNVFCVGMAYDDGVIHSEIGMYWEYVDIIQDINLID